MDITTTGNSIIINDGEKNLYFSKVNDGWTIETDKFEEVTTFSIPTHNSDLHDNEIYRIFLNFFKEIIGNYMIENLFLYDKLKVDPKEFVKEKKYRFNSDSARNEYVEFAYHYHRDITITIKINDLNKYRCNNRISLYYDCSLRFGFNVSFQNLFNNLMGYIKEKEEYEAFTKSRQK